jgi:uncharacterized membrane protein
VIGGISGAVGVASGVVRPLLVNAVALSFDPAHAAMLSAATGAGINLAQQLVSIVVQAVFLGGIVDFCLQVTRGQRPSLGVVFAGARYFVPMLIGQVLVSLAVTIGLLLCVAPGIIVALGLAFWSYPVVDGGLGPVASIQRSWAMTQGHKVNIFVFGLLAFVVLLGGLLACCVGLLAVSAPVLGIASAYVYLRLNHEHPTLASQ